MSAGSGNDILFGGNGDDALFAGGPGRSATAGDDLFGQAGRDRLRGDLGNDRIDGGPGGDNITGGRGEDDLVGGDGDDRIDARDGEQDTIDCGPGVDRVLVDSLEDGVFDCETVDRPAGPARGLSGLYFFWARSLSRRLARLCARFTASGLGEDLVRLALVDPVVEPVGHVAEARQVVGVRGALVGDVGAAHAARPWWPPRAGRAATAG